MKVFDLHADIGYDVIQKRKHGIYDIVKNIHLGKFKKGEVAFVCMASFFEGHESWEEMQDMVLSLKRDLSTCEEVDIVLCKEDLKKDSGHIKALLTMEGMCGIKDHPKEKITWLYDQGIRIASFCWNDENALATGVRGNPDHGLREMGKEALKTMIEKKMIIDVSHANEKTFWDILSFPEAHVIATHSNVRNICDHPRNLWKEQIIALAKRETLIGMNSAPTFVDESERNQDIEHLIDHIDYLHNLVGISSIAFGFDFMDFYEDYYGITKNLGDCTQTQNIIQGLIKRGYTRNEIERIAYRNAYDYFIKYLD